MFIFAAARGQFSASYQSTKSSSNNNDQKCVVLRVFGAIAVTLAPGSPAGPAEPWSAERLSDDRQELVPPPSGQGCPGVSGPERSQVQSLRQRPGGAHRRQVRYELSQDEQGLFSDWLVDARVKLNAGHTLMKHEQ